MRRAVGDGCEALVVGGGDGTINSGASVALERGIPLGVLPLGTLNHFAKDLGIPLELDEAAKVVLEGVVCKVDVGEVNGRIFLNNSSLGVYPAIVRLREKYQATVGGKWIAALWAGLTVLRRSPFMAVRIVAEGETIIRRTPLVLVGNNEYQMVGIHAGARESLARGRLALYVLNAEQRPGLLRLALAGIAQGRRAGQGGRSHHGGGGHGGDQTAPAPGGHRRRSVQPGVAARLPDPARSTAGLRAWNGLGLLSAPPRAIFHSLIKHALPQGSTSIAAARGSIRDPTTGNAPSLVLPLVRAPKLLRPPQGNRSSPLSRAIHAPTRIGILDLVTKSPNPSIYGRVMNANLASIMPQIVGVWCEQEGHQVQFVCYTGMEDLLQELPADLDLIFIGAFSQSAQLAYALSNFFRKRGAVTVLGGPHARCYPEDARKYFDYVLGFTDRNTIAEVCRECAPHRPLGPADQRRHPAARRYRRWRSDGSSWSRRWPRRPRSRSCP